ncbi:hypothetical protein Tco_1255591 [Tanacetum coccineum]
MNCLSGAAIAIFDELVSSITQVVNLFLDGKCPNRLGEYIASAPLIPLVKTGGGIRPIAVGTVWRRLVSKVSAIMIVHSLDGYLDSLQFGVGAAGRNEAILHSVNRLIEDFGDDFGLSMLLVDFKNAFNLVDREVMLREVHLRCPAILRWGDPLGPLFFSLVLHPLICKIRDSFSLSLHAWYLDDGTIIGDTMVVGKVLELIMEDGPGCGLHLNVDKTKVFWPKEDPRSRLAGIFPPNIARPFHGVKLLGGPASVDFDFCNELVMKRVAKTIRLMDAIAKINDPQCELLLLRSCTSISRLYFTIRTCLPRVFESAQRSFDVALRSSLECISAGLQTKLFKHTGIVSPGPIFDDALSVFNTSMKIDLLSNPSIPLFSVSKPCSRVFARDIYGDHAVLCAWIIEVDIGETSPLTQTGMAYFMPGRALIDVAQRKREADVVTLLKRIQKFSIRAHATVHIFNRISFAIAKGVEPKVFARDISGDHAVSWAGIIGIKHRHNVVRDTFVDICYRSRISVGKEVDIGLDGGGGIERGCHYIAQAIRKFSITQDIKAHVVVHIFNRIGFAIAKGVGAQIVSRLPSSFFVLSLLLDLGLVIGNRDLPPYLLRTKGLGVYAAGIPLFSVPKQCSACSRVFTGYIYGDHVVSCTGIIGIKHRHNVVRDTLIDIYFRLRISAGKEVDIGLGGGRDKPLRPADMLLYSWDKGLDVCVDLTGSSPLTQTGLTDFVPGRAVMDAAHRKRVKYEAKYAYIGYGFLPFSFSSLGELEKDAMALLKRI